MFTKSIYFYFTICLSIASNCLANPDLPYKEGELLVKFSQKTEGVQRTITECNEVLASFNAGEVKDSYKIVPGLTLVKLPENLKVEDALAQLKGRSEFLYVEPNWKIKLASICPNDTRFDEQWGMHNTGQTIEGYAGRPDADIDAPEAWSENTDAGGIIVAVLDSGVNYNHEDLQNNMWVNTTELNGTPNYDDDGNGYIDDIRGWDFADDDSDPMDYHGHGTHVAGIIGAVGNNGKGIAGICWNVQIMNLKIALNVSPEVLFADAISAIQYAVVKGAKVINASWGDGMYSQSLYDVIDAAGVNGILFVAAAGNYGLYSPRNNDIYPLYPATFDCDHIISVMSTDDSADHYTATGFSFSHYGETTVDIAAPGWNILSCGLSNGSYEYMSGTSMSTPMVAGACALLWAKEPSLTNLRVKQRILDGADILHSLDGKCVTEGRLNLFNTLMNIHPDPPEPGVHNISRDLHYYTIEDALLAAEPNNEIVVDEDTYCENIELTSSRPAGLIIRSSNPDNLSVVANTVIEGNGGSAIAIVDNENSNINGLTLHSSATGDRPATAYIENSTTGISRCQISSSADYCIFSQGNDSNIDSCLINGSSYTVGIYSAYGNLTVRNCLIEDCSYGIYGGSIKAYNNIISGLLHDGICLDSPPSAQIYGNIIYDNNTGIRIYNWAGGYVNIRNNTIANNSGGIYLQANNDRTTISNCILWDNDYWQIYVNGSGTPTVSYSCVKNGYGGTGNINPPAGPGFVDSANRNYHLMFGSPCIDANNTVWTPPAGETDIDGQDRVIDGDLNGTAKVDLGADEFWKKADFNYNGTINFKDYAILASAWMSQSGQQNWNIVCDISEPPDNLINFNDLEIFADFWITSCTGFADSQQQMQSMGGSLESSSMSVEAEPAPVNIDELIDWLWQIWNESPELRATNTEADWNAFIESVKNSQ